ncbi:MAG TPA: isocitrate lyase/phosphoenolpyruvate mutase family protein [Steroidobacteraceae bacterium]|nr:isocitrate lyase/phosphoenolpyruvate mutase family protein [Steroidobacteraceae bacterium]
MKTQAQKAEAFRALHARPQAFIIPNPWDAGTARMLARLGFEALATTSAGFAFSAGLLDNQVGREKMLGHVAVIAAATSLPVSADLENGFGDDPATVAETIRLAAATGIVGGSIEDSLDRPGEKVYDIGLATDRIRAAVEAVRGLPFPFTLTARAENYLVGIPDLADTIRRLQAYQEAGADVLYAPCITTREEITAIVKSVDRPVNFLMGTQPQRFTLEELGAMGVRRVSVGSALSAAALGAFLRGAREMRETGTFTYAAEAAGFGEISRLLSQPPGEP